MSLTFEAIILAAGEGRRVGGPKAGLRIGDDWLLHRQADLLLQAGCHTVHVVLGCQRERFRPLLEGRPGIQAVENPDWPLGPFSSLASGLRQVTPDAWVFVLPVDVFPVSPETFLALRRAAEEHPQADALLPTSQGRGGHPVLLSPRFVAHALTLPVETSRLDHILAASKTHRVEVPDPGIRANLNTQEDLVKVGAALRTNGGTP